MGFPSFNLCDSEENTGSQDHFSHCKIKAISELPHQNSPCINTLCNYHARGKIAAGFWGNASKSNLAIISIFYFSFLCSPLPFKFFFPFLASQNNMMQSDFFFAEYHMKLFKCSSHQDGWLLPLCSGGGYFVGYWRADAMRVVHVVIVSSRHSFLSAIQMDSALFHIIGNHSNGL